DRLLRSAVALAFLLVGHTASPTAKELGSAATQEGIDQFLHALSEARKRTPLYQVDCTKTARPFLEHFQTIDSVIEFFARSGIQAGEVYQNHRYFTYFEFSSADLKQIPDSHFFEDDRLVVTFVVKDRARDSRILSYTVNIFNSRGDL